MVSPARFDAELMVFRAAVQTEAFWRLKDSIHNTVLEKLTELYFSMSGSDAEIVRASLQLNEALDEYSDRSSEMTFHITGTLS